MNQNISAWNERWNGLPRKFALVAVTFALAGTLIWLLPFVWPFAAAFILSRIIEPFVRFVSKGLSSLSRRRQRAVAAVAGIILLFGLSGAAVTAVIGWLWQELSGFLRSLPQLLQWINEHALPQMMALYRRFSAVLPQHLPQLLDQALTSLSQNALRTAGSLSAWLTSGAWNTAASIPHLLFSIILMIMSTFYMTADRGRIAAFLKRTFPSGITKRSRLIRASLLKALIGQLRSQLLISLVVMFFLMLALGVSGVRYGAVIGMLIGIADALPLFGAGLFLIPWSLTSFVMGQSDMGITLACLYAGTIILRQILEPKLVGRQLGLYPLAAMAAMYIGYRLLGFLGLLAGPLLLTLAKAVLDADQTATQDPT